MGPKMLQTHCKVNAGMQAAACSMALRVGAKCPIMSRNVMLKAPPSARRSGRRSLGSTLPCRISKPCRRVQNCYGFTHRRAIGSSVVARQVETPNIFADVVADAKRAAYGEHALVDGDRWGRTRGGGGADRWRIHRDDWGVFWFEPDITFPEAEHLARQLGIVECGPEGEDPLWWVEDPDAGAFVGVWPRITVCYTGAVYNAREVLTGPGRDVAEGASRVELGQSGHIELDGEALVHSYLENGPDKMCIPLDGVFSFVLVDRDARIAVAGRDRYGLKPLFGCQDPHKEGAWVFSSSVAKLPVLSSAIVIPAGTYMKYDVVSDGNFPGSLQTEMTEPEPYAVVLAGVGGRIAQESTVAS